MNFCIWVEFNKRLLLRRGFMSTKSIKTESVVNMLVTHRLEFLEWFFIKHFLGRV